MKILLYAGAGVVVLVGVISAFFAINAYIYTEKQAGGETSELAAYFQGRMTTLAVERVGQPIEGFEPFMLIDAFPELKPADFKGVEAFEGRYEVASGEITFEREGSHPMTSAARTVSNEGYATLLENISARLSFSAMSEADVDQLVGKLSTGERVEVRIGESGGTLGVMLTPLEVLEESRCPTDVTCVQAGTVRVLTTLETSASTTEQTFTLNEPFTTETTEITLISVEPTPRSDTAITEDEYIFYFEIIKR